jgi:hypothetical protein
MQKKQSINTGCLIGLLAFIVILLVIILPGEPEKDLSPEESRTKAILDQFSTADGRHYNLQFFVEDHLNDPDSFEHISTEYAVKEDHILVRMQYRAKNGFNALIRKEVTAKVDLETGTVLEIVEEK